MPRGNPNAAANGRGTQFKKGRSGNPGGKTKEQKALERTLGDECKRITLDNLPRLEKLIKNPKTPDLVFLKALEFVADRGFGKAKQAINLEDPDGFPLMIAKIERVIVDPANPDAPRLRPAPSAGEV